MIKNFGLTVLDSSTKVALEGVLAKMSGDELFSSRNFLVAS